MKNKLLFASAFLLTFTLAVVAYANVSPRTLGDVFGFKAVVITKLSGVSDPHAGALHIGRLGQEFPSTTHRITRFLRGSYSIAFSAHTITCEDSGAQSLPGARTGDICIVSPPADGASANASFTCRVSAANAVIVRYCPAGTASTPGTDTYAVSVLSNQ
jgi:hypothetical protein